MTGDDTTAGGPKVLFARYEGPWAGQPVAQTIARMTIIEDRPAPAARAPEPPEPPDPTSTESRATIAELEERLTRQSVRRDGWTLFVFLFSALALVASVVFVGLGLRAVDESRQGRPGPAPAAEAATTAAATTASVTLKEFSFTPSTIDATVTGGMHFTNLGSIAHDVRIEGTDVATAAIAPADSAHLDLASVDPGEYKAYCTIPGHREAGMEANLRVTGGTGSAGHATGSRPMSAEEMDAAMAARTHAFPAETEGQGGQELAPRVLADGTKRFELTTSVVQWEVEPGKKVEAMAYNGTVPGPTIRVDPGDRVQVVLTNRLEESTAIHFHGLTTPNSQDGVPDITQPPVKPGETFTYEFTTQSTPMVGMYHSHHNAQVQVPGGLAGAFLIGRQPVPAGVRVGQELVMMLNDSGNIGFSINAKSFPATAPVVAKPGEWIEVHYMNEGQMVHPMHLHGMAQLVTAKDGFAVPQPYLADTVLVSPGERYTVLVHATEPGAWAWHCHILNHAERSDGMFGMVTALVVK